MVKMYVLLFQLNSKKGAVTITSLKVLAFGKWELWTHE